jgi:hypothetical protein
LASCSAPAFVCLITCVSIPDKMENIKGRARETYETASDRLGRATNALAGREDSQIFGKVGALLIAVGVSVGVGLLIRRAGAVPIGI